MYYECGLFNKPVVSFDWEWHTEVITDKELGILVYYPNVKDFVEGKSAAKQFLFGQIMKSTSGKADPKLINKLLLEFLVNFPDYCLFSVDYKFSLLLFVKLDFLSLLV